MSGGLIGRLTLIVVGLIPDRLKWRGAKAEREPLSARASYGIRPPVGDQNEHRFNLAYVDADGVWTERKVRISKASGYGVSRHFFAFCELRGEWRTFRLDRIHEMIDMQTGEVHSSPEAVFLRFEAKRRRRRLRR